MHEPFRRDKKNKGFIRFPGVGARRQFEKAEGEMTEIDGNEKTTEPQAPEHKAPEQGETVRRITLGFVAGWIWAVLAALGTLGSFTDGENAGPGVLIFLSGLVALPPFGTLLRKQYNIALSGWLKAVVVLGLVIAAGSFMKPVMDDGKGSATAEKVTAFSPSEGASTTPEPAPAKSSLPEDQAQFGAVNARAKDDYDRMDNDLKRAVVRKQRDRDAMSATLGGGFRGWTGTIDEMTTNGDGDAVVTIQLDGCPCKLKTWNNALSDIGSGTLIKNGSSLFNEIMNMSEGQKVRISGTILREGSLTEQGSVTDPEWITKFSDISPN